MQSNNPTTRVSLILRLNNREDAEAWEEFAAIYHPMVWRIAKRLGMSDDDAADACQNTMLRLTQVVQQWSPEKSNATFRGWLYRVARNCMLRQFERENKHARFVSDSDSQLFLQQLAAQPDPSSGFCLEFQRQVFANAAATVRTSFNDTNWQAFWLTYVKNNEINEVAKILEVTVSTIYVARSRVLKKIRDEVVRMSHSGFVSFPGQIESGAFEASSSNQETAAKPDNYDREGRNE